MPDFTAALCQNGGVMMRGAIFDVDGTLLDSMFIWDTIGEEYLCSIGFCPKENLNETFKNMSLLQAARYYREEYGVPYTEEEIMRGVNAKIEHYYRYDVLPKDGVCNFLQKLADRGVRMCIATATDEPLIRAALARCGIDRYFSEIFTCSNVGHGKDEPLIYREALGHLGTNRSDTVVFEDALYALETAKADGFFTAAVYDIHEKNVQKMKLLADYYMENFECFDKFWAFALSL